MAIIRSILILLMLFVSAAGAFSAEVTPFLPEESATLASQSKSINGRIKIYEAASQRIVQELQDSLRKEHFANIPDALASWINLLEISLRDIEANPKLNKKSKRLRKFEIHLRKTILEFPAMKLKVPYEQIDAFDSCASKAESIRKRIVDLLFKH